MSESAAVESPIIVNLPNSKEILVINPEFFKKSKYIQGESTSDFLERLNHLYPKEIQQAFLKGIWEMAYAKIGGESVLELLKSGHKLPPQLASIFPPELNKSGLDNSQVVMGLEHANIAHAVLNESAYKLDDLGHQKVSDIHRIDQDTRNGTGELWGKLSVIDRLMLKVAKSNPRSELGHSPESMGLTTGSTAESFKRTSELLSNAFNPNQIPSINTNSYMELGILDVVGENINAAIKAHFQPQTSSQAA